MEIYFALFIGYALNIAEILIIIFSLVSQIASCLLEY